MPSSKKVPYDFDGNATKMHESIKLTLAEIKQNVIAIELQESFFTKSKHGNPMLIIGKYRFGQDKRTKDGPKKRWVCNMRDRGCRVSVITLDNQIINNSNNLNTDSSCLRKENLYCKYASINSINKDRMEQRPGGSAPLITGKAAEHLST
ncbi:FLYWCH zinc finger domain-containing protein [Phthorimaea operculella]|nr:FLYWCH zinc finger domain-containing protein [Phthorimaea operculella]